MHFIAHLTMIQRTAAAAAAADDDEVADTEAPPVSSVLPQLTT
jgi:hypothetical protein